MAEDQCNNLGLPNSTGLSQSDQIVYIDPQLETTMFTARTPIVMTKLLPAKTTKVYETYWRFAAERQTIFFKRLEGQTPPWTSDQIFLKHKFTNAYRASDRVSQYLIRNIIYQGEQTPEEIFFRIMVFKIFNRIDTWELLRSNFGEIRYREYSYKRYNQILSDAMDNGDRIYSAAYIMNPGRSAFGFPKKHRNHLKLIELLMKDEIPERITGLKSMQRVFELMRSYPTLGDFLAYQFTIDINYSEMTDFSEMEFVVPGPGARDGIKKCFQDFGGLSEVDVIKLMVDRQQDEFNHLGINFRSLWGRPLQLIDCQNLFCEVDKYARVAHPEFPGRSGRIRIKQIFHKNETPINYWYPPKWGINHMIPHKRD